MCRSLLMANEAELQYFATPGPMTDLSACPPEAFAGLPDNISDLMKAVRRCVVAFLPLPEGRNDTHIRPAAEMVERILELDPSPLTEARPPERRFIGNCRHFATLTCALLRRTGKPARVRAGFAGYFEPDTWVDHWIIEYWSPPRVRWIRVDPQYGDRWFQMRDPHETSESVVRTSFLSGGQTWLRCRSGELDADRCKMGGVNWGIGEVRGSVMYDFAALNQDEMLPWDVWGQMEAGYRNETDAAYDELLDLISATTTTGDFDAIRELYVSRDDVRAAAS